MSEFRDPRDVFAERLRAEMPPVPSRVVLDRVRSRATAAKPRPSRAWLPSAGWRVAIGSAVALAAVVVGSLAIGPRIATMAFAREQAAAAVGAPKDGRVLHVVARFTETEWTQQYGHDPQFDRDQQWSEWADPAGVRDRMEVRMRDGHLDEMTMRVKDRELWLAGIDTTGTELFESSMKGKPFNFGVGAGTEYIRAHIADGGARVVGSETIGGDDCWVVKYEEPAMPDDSGRSVITFKLRKSDYAPKFWERVSTYKNGNGNCSDTARLEFETWEKLEPSSLPTSTFSFDDVMRRAPAGIKIEKRDPTM